MNRTIRALLGAGIALGALTSPVLAQGHSNKGAKAVEKSNKKAAKTVSKTYRKGTSSTRRTVTYRSRALCEDGTVVYRTSNTCAGHGGLASRQGTYASYPPASDRARARANENSAVVSGRHANNVRSGAIARCSDGTYWHASDRKNACYLHGGVARWH